MTYPITRTFWLEIMFRHGNNKLTAFGTAGELSAFWPHLLCAGFNTAAINPHFQDWLFLPSWKPGSQLKIFRAVGCICIVALSPELVVLKGGGVTMETKETLQPLGCSTIPFTNTMLSLCLCNLTPSAKRVNTSLVSQECDRLLTFSFITRKF